MPVLLITYALNTPGKDYNPLYNAIKGKSYNWWHYLDHTWIVSTKDPADDFAKQLYPFLTKLDRLLVVKITREHQGWLPNEAWEWLNKLPYS